jgi:hypothetical protein
MTKRLFQWCLALWGRGSELIAPKEQFLGQKELFKALYGIGVARRVKQGSQERQPAASTRRR